MKNGFFYQWVDHRSILVVNSSGKLRRLYVPFRAKCIAAVDNIPAGSLVIVEEVWSHEIERLLFMLQGRLLPSRYFAIEMKF